jgi:hypothetical protein
MSECIRLSDRMPAVAQGQAEWTAEELHHLNGCESCRHEWELLRITRRLGDGVLPAFDADATTVALLQRLGRRKESPRRRRAWSLAGLAAAAAIAVLLWPEQRATPPVVEPGPLVAGLQIPLPELDGLQPAELDSVLRSMDEPATDGAALEGPDLGDLDSEELETVLDFWEG